MLDIQFLTTYLLLVTGVNARSRHINHIEVPVAIREIYRRIAAPQQVSTTNIPENATALITSSPSPTPTQTDSDNISSPFSSSSSTSTPALPTSASEMSSILPSSATNIPLSLQTTTMSSSSSSTIAALLPTSTSGSDTASTLVPSALTSTSAGKQDNNNRTLIIVFSVVFALLGLALLFVAIVLLKRWRRRRARQIRNAVTPVEDAEIETWRGKKEENYTQSSSSHHRKTSSTVVFSHTPGWTWTTDTSPSSTRHGANGETILAPPPMVARAPNARSGLTDAAIPSEDPFIIPPRRQSTRLSKHSRNRSGRRSTSVSLAERPRGWADFESEEKRHLRGESRGSQHYHHGSSPPASIFNGASPHNTPSPFGSPKSQDLNDIGRAN